MNTTAQNSSKSHPSMSDDTENPVHVHPWNLTAICTKKFMPPWIKSWIGIILRVTSMNHTNASWPERSSRITRLWTWNGECILFHGSYSKKATYVITVHNVVHMKLLNNGYCIVTLDWGHWYRSVETLRDEKGMEWAEGSLCMCYTFSVDANPISLLPAIKVRKTGSMTSLIRHRSHNGHYRRHDVLNVLVGQPYSDVHTLHQSSQDDD